MKRNATRVLRLAIAAVLFAVPTLAQTPLPVPTGQVNDFANVVDAASRERMETMARNFRDRTGVDVAVVTLASLEGRPLEDVAIDMARSWGIGAGTDKDGLLVLLAVEDRRSRIETSRKLDDEITDGTAGAILRLGRPFFQEGRYGEGLTAVVESALATIAEKRGISIEGIDRSRAQREAPPRQPARDGGSSGLSRIIFLVVLILVISAISRGGGGGRGGRRRRYGGGPWIIPFPIGWGGGGGGSWGSSGGGGGGSWGGGGDSWGGFGGGGDFGGGGASDSW